MTIAYSGDSITFPDASTQNTAAKVGMVNRIINGAMVIDQRNAGASVTLATGQATYCLDRWLGNKDTAGATVTLQQSATAPAGFVNSAVITVSTGASAGASDQNVFQHSIEGFNTSDLSWGTASAQPITISFWVRASVAGTYGFSVSNNAGNRAYLATYTVSSANTFEYKTITIAGDTTGTWLTNNGLGLRARWDFGSGSSKQGTAGVWGTTLFNTTSAQANIIGTSGATFYITGVQLEKGSTATSFDYRDYGRELIMCQRYYYRRNIVPNTDAVAVLQAYSSGGAYGKLCDLPVTMRATPTGGLSAIGSFAGQTGTGNLAGAFTAGAVNYLNPNSIGTAGFSGGSGLAAGNATVLIVTSAAWIDATAEL